MNKASLACLLALAPAVAWANIIPTGTTITGSGPNYMWSYELQLAKDSNASTGAAPSSNPVPHTNVGQGSFLTLYDFAGYVPGSCASPDGWVCTAQNVGFTPDDVMPSDDAAIVNLTWAHTTGDVIFGEPIGKNLGQFTAVSIYNKERLVSYASRAMKNDGFAVDTIADNVGQTRGPMSSVPEPESLGLIGLGLAALVSVRRRKFLA